MRYAISVMLAVLSMTLIAPAAQAQVVCVVISGQLPPGMLLQIGGSFTGTPASAGTWLARLKCTAPGEQASELDYTLIVDPPKRVVKFGVTTLPRFTVGVPVNLDLKVTVVEEQPPVGYDMRRNGCVWAHLLKPLAAGMRSDDLGYAECLAKLNSG